VRTKKDSVQAEGARRNGDAVWVVPRTEVVTAPARVSFRALLSRQKQLEVVEQALDSFGSPEPEGARRKAVEEARKVIERTSVAAT